MSEAPIMKEFKTNEVDYIPKDCKWIMENSGVYIKLFENNTVGINGRIFETVRSESTSYSLGKELECTVPLNLFEEIYESIVYFNTGFIIGFAEKAFTYNDVIIGLASFKITFHLG